MNGGEEDIMPLSSTDDEQRTDSQQSASVLEGMRALVIGVANEHSIAWGCAKEMRRAGAEIAMTYLNEKARQYVEPLAREVDARVFPAAERARPFGTRCPVHRR